MPSRRLIFWLRGDFADLRAFALALRRHPWKNPPPAVSTKGGGVAGAFEGIRVLDLSDRLSGAWASRLFGDFGADVLLVEPSEGHPLRHEPPFLDDRPGAERSLLHAYANWNKRSVVLEDEESISALCAKAHVVVTTSTAPAGVPEGVAHLSITPHGLDGPLADVPGNNLTACARVGWATINKAREDVPLQLPARQSGYIAGLAGFVAAAAALYRGGGERIDLSETEALALTCAPWAVMGNFIGGKAMAFGPAGGRKRGEAGPLWRTRDGLINYGYGDWQQWTSAMRFLGLDDLAEDERFVSAWGRHQQDTRPVRDGLVAASAVRGKWEIFHGLAKRRCISGVVQNMRELRESEQFKARGFIEETSVEGRAVAAPGPVAKLSETPWALRRSAPKLGAHTAEAWSSPPEAAPPQHECQPLAGVRVLCFTQAWAGTFCTELLALMGADVVQIETVRRPDVWRGAGSPVPPAVRNPDIPQTGINTNGMYNSVNLNKRAITLDVTHPRGKAMFWRMIPEFDVLVDNFSPHVMTNWGVTLETLREHRPDIVFASVSGYGRHGPLAEYPANGATTEPMAGLASIHGYADGEAMNTGGLIPDPISGYTLAVAILAALNHRKRTGVGQRIDAAMLEAVAVQVGDALMEYDANGALRQGAGNRHPRFAPHGVYACATDSAGGEEGAWIAVAAEDDAAFAHLARHIGKPELASDRRFADNESRKANEDALDAILGAWFAQQDATAEAQVLGALGICAANCGPFKPIYADSNAQFEQRGFLTPVAHPQSGTHPMPVLPWRMARTPRIEARYSPCFGEHSREVFAEELGLNDDDYEELAALGVTGTERVASL